MPLFIENVNEWTAFFIFLSIIMFFIGLAEVGRKGLKLSPEISRKFVHVMVGILVSFAPFFLQEKLPVILLGLLFTVLNYIALKKDSLKGMHTTERVSFGTVYFPIAFTLLVVMFWERNIVIFIVSMLILAFSDTAATVVGEKIQSKSKFILWHDPKSWPGSITFFLTTIVVLSIAFPFYSSLAGSTPLPLFHLIGMGVFTAILTTIAEAVSKRGSDNLSLTLTAALSMDLYLYSMANDTLVTLSAWSLASVLFGYSAFRLRSLSISGGFGAFLLGVFMFGTGGADTMLPLIGFFVLSSILSKLSKKKRTKDFVSRKGSQRDIVQVYANGGIALVLALAWYISDFASDWLYWAFLASIAAATADTWESEIGSFSKKLPINIINGQRVAAGYSGGISLIGTLGGLLGAIVIASIALATSSITMNNQIFWIIVAGGFLGSIVDSILGATIQAKFVCTVCEKPTEKLTHCEQPSKHVSGVLWFDNDWVNVFGALSGAAIFFLAYYLFI